MAHSIEKAGESQPAETPGQVKFNTSESDERRLALERQADAEKRLAEGKKIKKEKLLSHEAARNEAHKFIKDPKAAIEEENRKRRKDLGLE